jgi:hemerythrin
VVKDKERFEILLEEIRDKVQTVAEGHDIVRKQILDAKIELKEDIKDVDNKLEFVVKYLGEKIDKIDQKIDEHVKLPAHI